MSCNINRNFNRNFNRTSLKISACHLPITPPTVCGQVKVTRLKHLSLQEFLDCALVIHNVRDVQFREAAHIMLDAVLDTEFVRLAETDLYALPRQVEKDIQSCEASTSE